MKINLRIGNKDKHRDDAKKKPEPPVLAKLEVKAPEESQGNNKTSQLRQDLVTGDWVVIATGRGKRPDEFKKKDEPDTDPGVDKCIFCDPESTGQEKDVLIYSTADDDWSLRVFPNKYPAFSRPVGGRVSYQEEGPYFWMEGIGYHEVIVTKDHFRDIGKMDPLMVAEVLDAYQTRYLDLMNKKSIRYIEIFHNHGKEAGASIYHPHSQLAAVPVISPYILAELNGAEIYHKANRECVYCSMLEWELEHRKRVIYENQDFVAFCPFASRSAFEVWVMPKKHKPYFERITDDEKVSGGEALGEAVRKISQALNGAAYNFYLHTSPCDGTDYRHYHWHIEILPKTAVWAGFELSTGIEISTILPETAAEYLKNT